MTTGVTLEITGLSRIIENLERMGDKPDFKSLARFETALAVVFAAVEERVHVITGKLLASGFTTSSFDGSEWAGTIEYAYHPGIFELARGNEPTKNHPEGEHNFFDAAWEVGPEMFGQTLEQWFEELTS